MIAGIDEEESKGGESFSHSIKFGASKHKSMLLIYEYMVKLSLGSLPLFIFYSPPPLIYKKVFNGEVYVVCENYKGNFF